MRASLAASVDNALQAGVRPENIIIDPGLGFGKTLEHNLEVVRRLSELKGLPGHPGRPFPEINDRAHFGLAGRSES